VEKWSRLSKAVSVNLVRIVFEERRLGEQAGLSDRANRELTSHGITPAKK
jgi:hypothetical protein